jgi:GT2 family glycosyltransferase
MAPFVHILFPTFDRPDRALDLMRQIDAQTYREFDVTCVDHGKTPVDFSSVEGARLAVVRAGTHLWWAGAMNVGLARILPGAENDDAVLTINDDVRIGPEFVAALANAAAERSRALVGSVCVDDATDRVLYADLRHLPSRGCFHSSYKGWLSADVPTGRILPCDVHSGRGTLIPVAAFREVGAYDDERLPHYGADYELSRRAGDRGFALVCTTDARVRTPAPPPDTSAGYGSFLEFATDTTRAGRIRDKWAFNRLCFGRKLALWACALELYRLGRIYARERFWGDTSRGVHPRRPAP